MFHLFWDLQFFIDFGPFWEGLGRGWGGFGEGLGRVGDGFGQGLGGFGGKVFGDSILKPLAKTRDGRRIARSA